jgi:TM2 domain-containing membrane protein YozV
MFYWTRNGQQFGPHSAEELRALLAQGTVTANDLVWREGMSGWAPAHAVFASVPPPPPPHAGGWAPGAPAYAGTGRSRVAFVLLGVFLGALGVHNFYAGYNGRAVAQLLLTVLVGWLVFPVLAVAIWALVEVITVNQDAHGVRFS